MANADAIPTKSMGILLKARLTAMAFETAHSSSADFLVRWMFAVLAALVVGLAGYTSHSFAQQSETAGLEAPTVPTDDVDPLKLAILELLSDPAGLPLPVRQRLDALQEYYANSASRVLWQDEALAEDFLKRLSNAWVDGLEPRDNLVAHLIITRRVNRLALTHEGQMRQAASAELYWSAAFLKYAGLVRKGRFLPTRVDPKLYWQEKKIDMGAALELIAALGQIGAFFDAWEPQIPLYKSLKSALLDYRAIEAAGGWPRVTSIELLKPGETHERVPDLRRRLAVTDEASGSPRPGQELIYDEDLVAAVKRFQRRHGMDADGIVGKRTYFQLNMPVADRIRQIELSMERVRWMPEDLGKHYIFVNIAGYELRRVENGEIRDVMRVVVGKPYHQTPVFSKTMKYVELNPYWNVPRSIAINEELAKLKSSPAALANKGFEAVMGDKAVPLTAVDWRQYSANNFPVQLRQKPGPENALGRVKFMFPNRFNVYMHDTPARTLFAEASRAFSHGCIRLARPIDMAEQVLGTLPGWNRKRIEEVLATGKRTVVALKAPIEVHITYSTSWRDENGEVQFRPDIYRRDAKLYAALFGKPYPF